MNITVDALGRFGISKAEFSDLLVLYKQAVYLNVYLNKKGMWDKIASIIAETHSVKHVARNSFGLESPAEKVLEISPLNKAEMILSKMENLKKIILVADYIYDDTLKLIGLAWSFELITSDGMIENFVICNDPNYQSIGHKLYAETSNQLSAFQKTQANDEANDEAIRVKFENQFALQGNQAHNKKEFIENLISEINADFGEKELPKKPRKKQGKMVKSNKIFVKSSSERVTIEVITPLKHKYREAIANQTYGDICEAMLKEAKESEEKDCLKFIYINPKNTIINTYQEDINEMLVELNNEIDSVEEQHVEALAGAIDAAINAGAQVFDLLLPSPLVWSQAQLLRAQHLDKPQKKVWQPFFEKVSQQNTYFERLPNEIIQLIFSYLPIEYFYFFYMASQNQPDLNSMQRFFNHYYDQNKHQIAYFSNGHVRNSFYQMIMEKDRDHSQLLDKLDFFSENDIDALIRSDIDFYKYAKKIQHSDWQNLTTKLLAMYAENQRELSKKIDEITLLNKETEETMGVQPETAEIKASREMKIYANQQRINELEEKRAERSGYPLLKRLIATYCKNRFHLGLPMAHIYDYALEKQAKNDPDLLTFLLQPEYFDPDILNAYISKLLKNNKHNENEIVKLLLQAEFEHPRNEEIKFRNAVILVQLYFETKNQEIINLILKDIPIQSLVKQGIGIAKQNHDQKLLVGLLRWGVPDTLGWMSNEIMLRTMKTDFDRLLYRAFTLEQNLNKLFQDLDTESGKWFECLLKKLTSDKTISGGLGGASDMDVVLRIYVVLYVLRQIGLKLPEGSQQNQEVNKLVSELCFDFHAASVDIVRVSIDGCVYSCEFAKGAESAGFMRLFKTAKPVLKPTWLTKILELLAKDILEPVQNNNSNIITPSFL
ncbi:MAG: hypothetical protein HKM04_10680 [Legionellales bacterium]|nr:hypothetical protein [Legionellales bacterium]